MLGRENHLTVPCSLAPAEMRRCFLGGDGGFEVSVSSWGTPSSHQFLEIFHEINHPAIKGVAPFMASPMWWAEFDTWILWIWKWGRHGTMPAIYGNLCGENGVFKHQILGYPIFRQTHRVMWLGVNQQGMPIRKHLKHCALDTIINVYKLYVQWIIRQQWQPCVYHL